MARFEALWDKVVSGSSRPLHGIDTKAGDRTSINDAREVSQRGFRPPHNDLARRCSGRAHGTGQRAGSRGRCTSRRARAQNGHIKRVLGTMRRGTAARQSRRDARGRVELVRGRWVSLARQTHTSSLTCTADERCALPPSTTTTTSATAPFSTARCRLETISAEMTREENGQETDATASTGRTRRRLNAGLAHGMP